MRTSVATRRSYGVLALPLLALLLLLAALPAAAAAPGSGTTGASGAHSARVSGTDASRDGWTPRPPSYPATTLRTDIPIEMSDGTVLRGDLSLPAGADGERAPGRFPVIVVITAYNKAIYRLGSDAAPVGLDPGYFARRGYAVLVVDARGTGSSGGRWGAFSPREQQDAGEIVAWAHSPERGWSNGHVGMAGASYMAISQLFAAAQHPPGLEAIVPQVPAADVYRDVVASGGQLDAGFIPLWLGLVTGTGLIPPAYTAEDPLAGLGTLVDHLMGATTFTLPLLTSAIIGGDLAYDGPFYHERSPIRVIDRVQVPTLLIGGWFDLFQRGVPLLYERLRQNGVFTRLIMGPWNHLEASAGTGLAEAGYGTLQELQLRWFDRFVKGLPDPTLAEDVAPLTYYEIGSGEWVRAGDWIGERHHAVSFKLTGEAAMLGNEGGLTRGRPSSGTATLLPVPVSGLCTRSASQWTAGVLELVWPQNPCLQDNSLNDLTGLVFQTAPLEEPLHIQGPINVRLFVESTSGDGMLSVSVSDVAPDGTVTRLTGGWQVISQRALEESRTRRLGGEIIQPYHPFTRESQDELVPGEVAPVDVEVFPTGAVIAPGHRLRVSVQGFDVPHLLPTLPEVLDQATVITIHHSERYPSRVTLPVVRHPYR